MVLPLRTLTTLNRQQLGEAFKDPRTLLAFEAIQLQVAQIIPETFAAFQTLDFVVTAADSSIPNAHLLTSGVGVSISVTAGAVTISLIPPPFGFGFDRDLSGATPSQPFVEFATEIQYTLAAGLSSSVVKLTAGGIAPSATTIFDLQIGGVSAGSISFSAGAFLGVLTMAADHIVTPGTTVQIVAPASLNGMMGRLFGTVVGTR